MDNNAHKVNYYFIDNNKLSGKILFIKTYAVFYTMTTWVTINT